MSDEDGQSRIECSMGNLRVEVVGNDLGMVSEEFEEIWTRRLEEASEMIGALREYDRSTR